MGASFSGHANESWEARKAKRDTALRSIKASADARKEITALPSRYSGINKGRTANLYAREVRGGDGPVAKHGGPLDYDATLARLEKH